MGVVITITNGGGSAEPVRVDDGTRTANIVPGQESYSIEVPAGGEIKIGAESLYLNAPAPEPPDPTVAAVKDGDTVTVLFADGTTEVDGSPGVATVMNSTLEHVKLTV